MVTFTDPASLVGETLADAAYASTSLLSWIAEGFLLPRDSEFRVAAAEPPDVSHYWDVRLELIT